MDDLPVLCLFKTEKFSIKNIPATSSLPHFVLREHNITISQRIHDNIDNITLKNALSMDIKEDKLDRPHPQERIILACIK